MWWIVSVKEEDIGTIYFENEESPKEYRMGIYLSDNDKLGKGFGQEIIKIVIMKIKKNRSAKRIILDVRKNNIRAISCYRKVGFTIESEENDIKIPYYQMGKDI